MGHALAACLLGVRIKRVGLFWAGALGACVETDSQDMINDDFLTEQELAQQQQQPKQHGVPPSVHE